MISIKNLVKIYNKGKGNEYKALKGIDFQVQDGELVAVIGKSGAGKSTLLHVLAGIDSFESGSYHVGNQDVGQMSEKQLAEFRNKSIGMVMQDFALIEEYTVQENLLVPLIFGKVKKREQSKKIMDVLEKVNIAELKDKRVNQLSGGQKQRVAIARAITVSRLTTFFLIISPPVCSRLPGGLNNSSIGILNCHCQAIFQKT